MHLTGVTTNRSQRDQPHKHDDVGCLLWLLPIGFDRRSCCLGPFAFGPRSPPLHHRDACHQYFKSMTLSEDLRSAGVITYNTVKDVPYAPDYTWGTFNGSFGTVYKATTKRFVGREQVYAIKEIRAISRKDQLLVAQEIRFLRQFRHPNILELKEAYIIDLPGHAMRHGIHLVTRPWAPVSLYHFIDDLNISSGSSTMCSWFKPQELEPWPSILR